MPNSIHERTVAFDVESSINGGVSNWDSLSSDGSEILFTEVNAEALQQAVVENKNLKQDPLATRADLLALKSGEGVTFASYMYGSEANAAEGAQASQIPLDVLIKNAMGGMNTCPSFM